MFKYEDESYYEEAIQTGNGVGGFGQPSIPKDKYTGWKCPCCSKVYSPLIKECSYCNRINIRKWEVIC